MVQTYAFEAPKHAHWKYYFSLNATILPGIGVDAGPRGIRAHVGYESANSEVTTEALPYQDSWQKVLPAGWDGALREDDAPDDRTWNGLQGKIASGGDFMLVRKDGVIDMDGRVTICAADKSLVDAVYRGSIDLATVAHERHKDLSGNGIYRALQLGEFDFKEDVLTKKPVPLTLALSVAFETANTPEATGDGSDMSWVKGHYRATSANYWRYGTLVRRSFMAIGTLALQKPTLEKPISGGQIALRIYEVAVGT
jgi:hypothetical protein